MIIGFDVTPFVAIGALFFLGGFVFVLEFFVESDVVVVFVFLPNGQTTSGARSCGESGTDVLSCSASVARMFDVDLVRDKSSLDTLLPVDVEFFRKRFRNLLLILRRSVFR